MPKLTRRSSRRSNADCGTSLADRILHGMNERADEKTKAWFTNYVKGTQWIGCKVPVVRSTIQAIYADMMTLSGKPISNAVLVDNAIQLVQNPACDAKLAGMILLSEKLPIDHLASGEMLDRLDRDVWNDHSIISDWSSADWFSNRVLSKIVFAENSNGENNDFALSNRVLGYSRLPEASLWQRRCGVVSFLKYDKHRTRLPENFGSQLIEACQDSLLLSPDERFTQTGIAWVLRYVLLEATERDEALAMICRHGSVWTNEAKKSLAEKLSKSDKRRKQILDLA